MSKEQLNSESHVLDASLDMCNKIRLAMIHKFDYLWVYVYTKGSKSSSATITASNAFGGKLDKSLVSEIVEFAKDHHRKLKS